MPLNTNAAFQALPLVEPIAYGRSCAGKSSVALSHDSATSTYTIAAGTKRLIRRIGEPRSPTYASSASPGSATIDSSSLTLKATPSSAAPPSSQPLRSVSIARTIESIASTSISIITASIVSLREVITSIGSTAIATAAAIPAVALHIRRTTSNSSGTDATPASASGSFRAVAVNPSSLTLATWNHRSMGGLSIDTVPPGSNAPKKKLCQDLAMLRTAAS